MAYYIKSLFGPTGARQVGYQVVSENGDIVSTFKNKEYGYWRFAKNKAEAEAERLNRDSEK